MKLQDLLKEMWAAMERNDLSDSYLIDCGCSPRRIGEFQNGVSMVPCDWVYPYLKALAEDERLRSLIEDIEADPEAYMERTEG